MNVNTLIVVAVMAWGLQIILGWWQVSCFNRAFDRLCALGKVGVGRATGRFGAKIVIALAFDQNQCVAGSLLMKGYTVFSRPRAILALHGLKSDEIIAEKVFPHNPKYQEALRQVIH